MLDWEFCVAATPAYDLVFVEHSLLGGYWTMLPEMDDLREIGRSSLLAGYHEGGQNHVIEQFDVNYNCYGLLAEIHSMLHFEGWFDRVGISDNRREVAADNLRKRVEDFC